MINAFVRAMQSDTGSNGGLLLPVIITVCLAFLGTLAAALWLYITKGGVPSGLLILLAVFLGSGLNVIAGHSASNLISTVLSNAAALPNPPNPPNPPNAPNPPNLPNRPNRPNNPPPPLDLHR